MHAGVLRLVAEAKGKRKHLDVVVVGTGNDEGPLEASLRVKSVRNDVISNSELEPIFSNF